MADLAELDRAEAVKVAGASNITGIADNYMDVDTNGNAHVIATSAGPVTPGTVASNSNLIGGQFNTALPTLTTGQQAALQADSSGRLLVNVSNASIAVTGTFWQATQPISVASLPLPTGAATSANQTTEITSLQLIDNPVGSVGAGTAGTSSYLIGGVFNTTLPILTTGQQAAIQVDSSGRIIISPTAISQGTSTSGQTGNLIMGAVTTNPPLYTTAQTDSLSLTVDGDLRTADIVNTSGQYRAQSVTTTAAEALGAATILANRKSVTITPTNGTIYWGYSNAVTTSSGTPIFKNQCMSFAVGANVHVYVISASTVDCRISEGS